MYDITFFLSDGDYNTDKEKITFDSLLELNQYIESSSLNFNLINIIKIENN